MKISVLLPTTGSRLSLLIGAIESLYKTTEGYDVELVLVVDENKDVLNYGNYLSGEFILDYSRTRRGALRCWNRGLELSTGRIIVPAGDDQLFHEGWLGFALQSHFDQLEGRGVVGMNDLAYDGNTQVATMFLFDREYCKEVMGGVFAPPQYKYYCIDSEWNEKAKLHDRFYWDSRSKVEHLHAAHNKRPVDSLDLEKQEFLEHDTRVFEERKSQGFPIDYPSII